MSVISKNRLRSKTVSQALTRKSARLINGKLIEPTSSKRANKNRSKSVNIQKFAESLSAQRIASDSQFFGDEEDVSTRLLYLIGCEVSHEKHDFSLLTKQTDEENVDNPNIFDEYTFSTLTNEKLDTLKSFSNVDDPFYCLDDDLPRAEKEHNKSRAAANTKKQQVNLVGLTSDVYSSKTINSKNTNTRPDSPPQKEKRARARPYTGKENKQKKITRNSNRSSKNKTQTYRLRTGKKALNTGLRLSVK
mgnify:CR=1 FL=1